MISTVTIYHIINLLLLAVLKVERGGTQAGNVEDYKLLYVELHMPVH